MIEILSICRARRGKSSEIWIPGTRLGIALKAEFGLGSHVSIWLGPPSSQIRMQLWAFAPVDAPAAAARLTASRYWLRLIPTKFRAPSRRKSRRP